MQKGLQEHGTIKEAKSTRKSQNTVTQDQENKPPKHGRNGKPKTNNEPVRHQTPLPSRPQHDSNFGNTERVPGDPKSEQGLVDPDTDIDSDSDAESDISNTSNSSSSSPRSSHALLSKTAPPMSLSPYLSEERIFRLARRYAKKWMRSAGVKEESVAMVDESSEDALPSWTKGIVPKLEGRIRVVGEKI